MGHSVFTVVPVDGSFHNGTRPASEGGIHSPFCRFHIALYNGQVFSVELVSGCHAGQNPGADHVLGDYGKTGGIPVQPVDTAENEGLPLTGKIPGQSVGKGVFIIVQRRVNGHSGSFVEYHQIFILVENIQRKLHRRYFFRGNLFPDMDGEKVSGLQGNIHITGTAVDQDAVSLLFQLNQILAGIAKAF